MEPIEVDLTQELVSKGYELVIYAKDQPEYKPLPAISNGQIAISRWHLSDEDIKILFKDKCIYLLQMTFGQPLQPVMLDVDIKELA